MEVINLNKFDRKRRIAESVKQMYPPGIRIELICMNDPYSPEAENQYSSAVEEESLDEDNGIIMKQ